MDNKSPTVETGRIRFNPWLFFGVFAAPGIGTTLIMIQNSLDDLAYLFLLTGSIIAGLFCGIHLAITLGRNQTGGVQIAIGIVSVIGCGLTAFALGLGGCMLVHGGSHGDDSLCSERIPSG